MRVLPIVAMLGCGSPMHAVDAPAADTALPDAPVDVAAPVNRWTFNGKTYTSLTATCELPTGSPYWFVHSIGVEASGHELLVYFLYPHPSAAGTYGCIGNPNSLVTGQAVIAAGDAPSGVYYATGGQLVVTVSGATVTATFANVPTELGSSGIFSTISGTVTCPSP
jgi:hypothetical protein